jgi:hypothetical protein
MGLFKLRKKVTCEEYGKMLAEEAFATLDQSLMKIWFSMLLDESEALFSSEEAQRIIEWIPFLRLFEIPLYFRACDKQILSFESEKNKRQKIVQAFKTVYQDKVFRGMNDPEKKESEGKFMRLFPLFEKIEDLKLVPVQPARPYIVPVVLTEILRRLYDYAKKTGRLDKGKLKGVGSTWITFCEGNMLPLAKTLAGNEPASDAKLANIGMGIKLDLLSISSIVGTVGAEYFPRP